MFRRNLIAIHFLAAEFAVEGMKIQAVLAGDERISLVLIGAQFIRRTGVAGLDVVRSHQSAARAFRQNFSNPPHVIPLPAVKRDGDLRQGFKRLFNVHSQAGITFPRQGIRLFNIFAHRVQQWNFVVANYLKNARVQAINFSGYA